MNSCSYWKLASVNMTQGKLVNINHNSAKAEGLHIFLYTSLSNRIHYFPCCNKVQHMVMKAKGNDLSTSESPKKNWSNHSQMVDKELSMCFYVCWLFPRLSRQFGLQSGAHEISSNSQKHSHG